MTVKVEQLNLFDPLHRDGGIELLPISKNIEDSPQNKETNTKTVCESKVIEDGNCRFKIDGSPPMCRRRGEFLCVEELDKNLPNLSHSTRCVWVKCHHAYYLNKVRGINARKEKMSPPGKYGTMWDKFQENKYGRSHDLTQLAGQLGMTDLEIARFNALTSVFNKLKLATRNIEGYVLQKKILMPSDGYNVVGYLDRAYDDHFVEVKISVRPDYYLDPFNISYQVGTYFLANPQWKYVIMEVARIPGLKWDSDNENLSQYEARLTKDIMKRAPMYFPGLKRKECSYGRTFFRSEFPLDEIKRTYEIVGQEIKDAVNSGDRSTFYKSFNCSSPYPCEYLPICQNGIVSNTLFKMRNTGEPDIEEELEE
jgi:hypothetical protein